MRTISPDALMPAGPDRYTKDAVGEAWAQAYRMLRAELANPEVREVFVMIGTPGSGKSTWSAIQPDRPEAVVFDAVWSNPERRTALVKRIRAAGKQAIGVVVRVPLGMAIDRNSRRDVWRRVPETQLRKAWEELLRFPPDESEGWSDLWWVAGTDARADRRTSEEQDARAGRVVYRWRTEEDDRVRPEHKARHGRLFSWAYPPEGGPPGSDYGCRCWAEMVADEDVVETRGGQLRARPLTTPSWARRRPR